MDPGNFASSTAEAAFEVDDRGRIVIWNRAAEQLLGYSAGQAIGKPCFELLYNLSLGHFPPFPVE